MREPLGRWIAVAAFAAAAAGVRADETQPGAEGPRIAVDTADFQFGRVPNDRAVEHVFKVTNGGTKPLVITRVQTSCGCTAAMMESSVIDPGKAGRLRVSFNPRGQKQVVTRTITMYSNDPIQPTLQLKVSAEVVAPDLVKKVEEPPKRAHPAEPKLVLAGACLKCHGPASPSETGRKLYASACAACHGTEGQGVTFGKEVVGPPLRLASMSVKTPPGLTQVIAAGTGHPAMPGYGKEYGGPLSDAQVASLVDLISKSLSTR